MNDTLSLRCPVCARGADFAPGVIACECGAPYDPCTPPSAPGPSPGQGIWSNREAVGGLSREASLGEGGTPLLPAEVAGRDVLFKLEYTSPTGSFKDRGAAYCLSLLASLGADSVAEDSSGNAGAAYAAYAAALGLRCRVFVPDGAPAAKVAAIRRYGADVTVVPGGREAAHREALASPSYAGHAWAAPFLVGVGTIADEILQQTGGAVPDEIILPVGQGGLLYAIYLAFRRLHQGGRVRSVPALSAVQASNCAPLHSAARQEAATLPRITPLQTLADAVAIERPVRWAQVLQAVRETGGEWTAVTEGEIGEAVRSLGAIGHDVEPASALPWAAILGRLRSGKGLRERTVVPLTGTGWKRR